MTAADLTGVLGARKPNGELRPLLDTLRAGVNDPDVLFASACAGGLGEWGDTVSVPLLARAYATRGKDAEADARISIRDALRALAGRAFADSVEQANPVPQPAASYPSGYEGPPKQ